MTEAVALEGFVELTETLTRARLTAQPDDAVGAAAHAYSAYALDNPALYDAMFTRANRLTFSAADTPTPLSSAYAELRAAVSTIQTGQDIDTLTEVFWAALHGLVTLGRNHRLRSHHHAEQIELLIAQFAGR